MAASAVGEAVVAQVDYNEFEVCTTITTGLYVLHIPCDEWLYPDWSSLQKYPRAAEIIAVCDAHVCEVGSENHSQEAEPAST